MSVTVTPSDDGRFVLVRHSGQLLRDTRTEKAAAMGHEYASVDRVLLDFRDADCGELALIDVDSIAASVRRLSPQVQRVAIVPPDQTRVALFRHAINLLLLQEIDARLESNFEHAQRWLRSA